MIRARVRRPRRHSRQASAVLAAFLGAGAAAAAPAQTPAAHPEDVATLDGIIAAWYDVVSVPAGVAPDWARDSTLYLPDVRFVLLDPAAGGGYAARVVDHAAYVRLATPVLRRGFGEREIHRVTQRFGPLVHVFSTYEYRRTDGSASGRGINSIQLFHDGTRWWIVGAAWMDEDEANPIPPQYLPGG